MNNSIIDSIYKRNAEILRFLDLQHEVTFRSDFEEAFKKTLVLSIASYFEYLICEMILKLIEEKTHGNQLIFHFAKNKGISRQYHTFFNWRGRNANQFFSLFGEEFKRKCSKKINAESELDDAVRAFLDIGETRNNLVHMNYADYQLPKTSEEYYNLYVQAMKFIRYIEDEFNNYACSNGT